MVVILAHGDGDGICAASIVKMVPEYKEARLVFSHPSGINQDLRGVKEDLIVVDIAIDERFYKEIYKKIEDLTIKGFSVLYFDHHKVPNINSFPIGAELIHDEEPCTSELVYRYFFGKMPMPEYADHFVCIGAICDYLDNTPFMKEIMHQYERRTLFFDAGILAQGLNGIRHNYEFMRKLVANFSRGVYPCEMSKLVNKALKITREDKMARKMVLDSYQIGEHFAWIRNPPASKSKAAHWIMADSAKIIGITVTDRMRKGINFVDISIRGRRLVDMRKIIPSIAEKLGGTGGGHENAIGCRVSSEKLNEFLTILDKELDSLGIENPVKMGDIIRLDQIQKGKLKKL
ncbi:MAG: DHH family phosphoesterase [archaeon]|nr:DHH family phosphoesterase [archaeon]